VILIKKEFFMVTGFFVSANVKKVLFTFIIYCITIFPVAMIVASAD
jgi:hypothetical protein